MGAGLKQNYGRQVDSGSWQDDFGIAKAAAESLGVVSANKVRNSDGVSAPNVAVTILYLGTGALTLTDFAGFPIGTVIIAAKITTPTIYIHKAQTASPVVGDWYKIEGTQCT